MNKRDSEYKPLLYTTTVRSPERVKNLLNILSKFNGQVLNDKKAEEIMGEIIRYGLYRPMIIKDKDVIKRWGSSRINESSIIGLTLLTDKQVKQILIDNPQNHKEAGFDKGWSSRFATIFDFAKELGFVFYWQNEKIKFSELGLMLANSIEIKTEGEDIFINEIHPELEEQAFLLAMAKSQRNNPFVRVLNDNVPLILLLEVIKKLNDCGKYNGAGISKLELPLIIFWKNNNAEELFQLIQDIRSKYGYSPSPEIIIDICINRIMLGELKKFKPKSIISEYPDEFIRKMRLTGIISLRGGGRFIDINHKEEKKVNYILEKYSDYKKFDSEREYFNYMAEIDTKLISFESEKITIEESNKYLSKWVEIYSWEQIKNELKILAERGLSKDRIFKLLKYSTRLEFLVAIAIKSKYPNVQVIPNYKSDDEGVPTSTAIGNGDKGDIECYESSNGVLIEVSMSEGRQQTMMEYGPLIRHFKKFNENQKISQSKCFFIAPTIYPDTKEHFEFARERGKALLFSWSIKDFITDIENVSSLYDLKS